MSLVFRLLARRARSRAELEAALAARGVSGSLVRSVLGRVAELGYLDDRRLAAEAAERMGEQGYGALRIQSDLERRGIAEAVAATVLPDAAEEKRRARSLLDRRFPDEVLRSARERGRAARFLAARGFRAEVVDSLLDLWE